MKNSPIMNSGTVSKIDAADLFCGAGGLSHGLIQAGINVQLGIDLDPACEYPFTQNNNADFLREDIQKIEPESVEPYFRGGNIRLLAGCWSLRQVPDGVKSFRSSARTAAHCR